jgi:hypothetical protein
MRNTSDEVDQPIEMEMNIYFDYQDNIFYSISVRIQILNKLMNREKGS